MSAPQYRAAQEPRLDGAIRWVLPLLMLIVLGAVAGLYVMSGVTLMAL